jgi:hypothetical protein
MHHGVMYDAFTLMLFRQRTKRKKVNIMSANNRHPVTPSPVTPLEHSPVTVTVSSPVTPSPVTPSMSHLDAMVMQSKHTIIVMPEHDTRTIEGMDVTSFNALPANMIYSILSVYADTAMVEHAVKVKQDTLHASRTIEQNAINTMSPTVRLMYLDNMLGMHLDSLNTVKANNLKLAKGNGLRSKDASSITLDKYSNSDTSKQSIVAKALHSGITPKDFDELSTRHDIGISLKNYIRFFNSKGFSITFQDGIWKNRTV